MRKLIMLAATVAATCVVAAAHATVAGQTAIRRWFGYKAGVARCVAWTESRFVARATHVNRDGTVDRGEFQINSTWIGHVVEWYQGHHGVRLRVQRRLLLRPRYNTRVAWAISKGGTDWSAWRWECGG